MIKTNLSGFGVILLFIFGALAFVGVAMFAGKLLRPHRPNEEKNTPYECGEDPVGNAWGQFNMRFYIVALIFLLFEVELLFLFPWSVTFAKKELIKATGGLWGWFAFTEMCVFIALLALGLAYAWVKGYLNWVKPKPETRHYASPVPMELYEEINKKYAS